MQQKIIPEFIIEFRPGNYFQNLEADFGGPISTAQVFSSKEEAECFMDKHNWIYFNGGVVVPKNNRKKIVTVVDINNKKYYDHYTFDTLEEAEAFAKGMKTAWKISHGQSNYWRSFVMDHPVDFQEWKDLGFPGKKEIEEYL